MSAARDHVLRAMWPTRIFGLKCHLSLNNWSSYLSNAESAQEQPPAALASRTQRPQSNFDSGQVVPQSVLNNTVGDAYEEHQRVASTW